MNAQFSVDKKQNGKNLSDKKELLKGWSFVVDKTEVVSVRWYSARNPHPAKIYCTVWIHGNDYRSGHGSAGGYGYDRFSSAFSNALESSGITLDTYIDGAGDSAVREAIDAIVRALGYDPSNGILVCHS